jgi:HEAT repeat protein
MAAALLRDAAVTRPYVKDLAALEQGLAQLPARLSEASVMAQLLQAIDESSPAPDAASVETLFLELQPSALESLLRWLGSARTSLARATIERASLRLASSHSAELCRLLELADVHVVHGALRIVTGLATPAAVPALGRLLGSSSTRIRLEAVAALREIATPGALRAIETATEDADREVRVAALRTITVHRHVPAAPRLRTALRRKELRNADLGEKMALFEAFGTICGDDGVGELDSLLNARSLLGVREPSDIRACAARALGMVRSPRAVEALERAVENKDLVVRSAIGRALRGTP